MANPTQAFDLGEGVIDGLFDRPLHLADRKVLEWEMKVYPRNRRCPVGAFKE